MKAQHITTTLSVLILVLAADAGAAHADARQALHRARLELSSYDMQGRATVETIARLEEVAASREALDADRREARFLRAMAATDLVIAAVRRDDEALLGHVAEAFDAAPDRVAAILERELRGLMFGIYAQGARQAVDALEVVQAMASGERVRWTDRKGLRRDVLYVGAVARRLERADDPVATLASFAGDPCDGVDELCPVPYGRFDATGRRAMAALAQAHAGLERLARAADGGDPLPSALQSTLASDRERILAAVLEPAPRVGPGFGVVPAAPGARPAHADVVLAVSEGEVRWGWTPRVRMADDGQPYVEAAGRPMLPEMESVRLPRGFRPAVRSIRHVVETFSALERAGGREVAFGVAPSTPAHVLARVLKSLQEAGMEPTTLVGRADDGTVRGVPVRLVGIRDAQQLASQVEVRVRLGGYSLVTAAGPTDFPRVRGDEGLRFDVAGLVERARREPIESASIDFMTVVASGPVVAAAFRLQPEQEPVTLVLP